MNRHIAHLLDAAARWTDGGFDSRLNKVLSEDDIMVPSAAMLFIVRVEGMPWVKTSAANCHAQLRLPDKSSAIKVFVGCLICYFYLIYACLSLSVATSQNSEPAKLFQQN